MKQMWKKWNYNIIVTIKSTENFLCVKHYLRTLFFIFGTERERDSTSRRDTEFEADSRLWAVSTEPNSGLKATHHETMTWTKVRHSTKWATQAPQHKSYCRKSITSRPHSFSIIWTKLDDSCCHQINTSSFNHERLLSKAGRIFLSMHNDETWYTVIITKMGFGVTLPGYKSQLW